jgi:hypothetical protein
MTRLYPEESLQRTIVQHLTLRAASGVVWYHCPNGVSSSARTGARMKAMGIVAGVSDMVFLLPSGLSCFMEVKAPKGRLTPEQKVFRDRVEANGAQWAMVRTIDEALLKLKEWGIIP